MNLNMKKNINFGNSNKFQILPNDERNNSVEAKINNDILKDNNQKKFITTNFINENISEKNSYFKNNFFSKDNLMGNNKNKESSLKIQIPFDVMDNHPVFFVQRTNDKNKNFILFFNIL